MSSVGQGLGGIVGGVIGFMVGGPSGALYGAQVGMMVGGLLDPPKVEGPRLEDLSQQTSTYGVFIPRAYGTVALHGNVFWIQGDSLIERGVESGGKGGPEVTNYEYYASFAISLCEGPIDGVRRIWIGGQLWYDAGSNDLDTIIASNEIATRFTLYTGTETQGADPLIQADRGAANVPAYRGLAYIVFNELPLKDVGNTIAGAQVKVEVIRSGTWSHGRTIFGVMTGSGPAINTAEYPNPSYPYGSVSEIYSGDITGRQWNLVGWERAQPNFVSGRLELEEYQLTYNFSHSMLMSPAATDMIVNGDFILWCTHNARGHQIYASGSTAFMVTATNSTPLAAVGDWALDCYLQDFEFYVKTPTGLASVSYSVPAYDDLADYSIKVTRVSGVLKMYLGGVQVATQVGTDNTPLSGGGLSIGGYTGAGYTPNDYGSGAYSNVVLVEGSPATYGVIPLSEIVKSECLRSNLLTASDIDVAELTDSVRGYRVSSLGPIRGGIDPLRKAWPFDVVQHGYQIKFKTRGGASVATITEAELDAREAGASPGVQVTNIREMDTILPDQLTTKYLDAAREYDINVAEQTR
mgnify:CR=1 FL=1